MPDTVLFVVLGAGSSYAAASAYYDPGQAYADRRPPLTKDLFDGRFADILKLYPMAKGAAPDILDAISDGGPIPAVSLEEHLRTRYRDSADEYDQRRFNSMPLYLQHVLWWVGAPPELHFDHLDRLVNRLVANFPHVCFITLNYDLLLDRCLAALHPLGSLRHYTAYERWSLIKLHGSVSWGHRLDTSVDLNDPPAVLPVDRSQFFHTWAPHDAGALRQKTDGTERFDAYPALSVPLGPDDEIVCPREHRAYLHRRLGEAGDIDLLVVGYSGLDKTVLDALKNGAHGVRTLYIVDRDEMSAVDVAKRMCAHFGMTVNRPGVACASVGFEEWVRSGLPEYPEWVATEGEARGRCG